MRRVTVAVDAVAAHVAQILRRARDRPIAGTARRADLRESPPTSRCLSSVPGPGDFPQLSTLVTLGCWHAAHTSDGHGTEFIVGNGPRTTNRDRSSAWR